MIKITTPFKLSLLASAIALTGCGSSSDDSPVDSQGRAGAEVSSFTISAKGGASINGQGGQGGYVEILKYNSASELNIEKEGVISSSYTLPEQEPQFGTNAAILSESETVQLVYVSNDVTDTSTHLPDAGKLYLIDSTMIAEDVNISNENLYRLYKSDGISELGADNTEVTGLTIEEGANLILKANNGGTINLYFKNDIQNNGSIFTENEDDTRLNLDLMSAAYYGNGAINLSGSKVGQSGGNLTIFAHTIKNAGEINTSGATDNEGGTAGSGGQIQLYANVFIENKGLLNTSGGVSAQSTGGEAGDIYIEALEVFNTASITANKGAGRSAIYNSNSADVYITAAKSLINTGDIDVLGGKAHGNGNYSAGRGGDIYFNLTNSPGYISLDKALVNTGNLNVSGGSVSGDADGRGGYGGSIEILAGDEYLEDGDTPDENFASALSTSVNISGNLSANGGSTESAEDYAYAGPGGSIEIAIYDQATSNIDSNLLGYDNINVNGGDGLDGSYGGQAYISSGDYRDERGGSFVPALSGPIANSSDITANGGSSLATEVAANEDEESGYGRRAGYISLSIENAFAYLEPGALSLSNTGSISATGGRSFNDDYSANGGNVSIIAPGTVTVTNSITLDGGSDEHNANTSDNSGHIGANGGNLVVISQYSNNSLDSTISANGGKGDLEGGDAGFIMLAGKTAVSADGSISLNGGNALENNADSHETDGGDAGYISLLSGAYNSAFNTTVTAEPGTGDTTGEPASIIVDADCKSDYCDIEAAMGGSL
jgi:hypothetical protein